MNKPQDWRSYFLPARAYESEETLRLHRFFVTTCFVTSLFATGYCLMSIYMSGPYFAQAMAVSFILFVFMPFLLRAGVRLVFLVNSFLTVIGIVAILLIYWEGGIRRANVSPWIMVLPAFAMMLHGARLAAVWLAIALAIVITFSYFTFQGVIFPVRFDQAKDPLFSTLSMAGLVCLITFIFYISERERRRAHESLAAQNVQLDKLSREKTKFLQIAAHDLRNPLVVIQALAERTADPDMTAPERAECLDYIMSSTNRMSELIRNLLEIEVIDAGRINVKLQSVSLSAMIKGYISRMEHMPSSKQAEIILNMPDTDVAVTSDPARVEQILDNYISNAIKYSPIGSKVYVDLRENATFVELKVKDEGPGLNGEEITKLFKQFSTTSSVPRDGEHATGLGLAIVKKIADALNAEVGCTSQKGDGCTFYIRFPAAMAAAAPVPEEQSALA